MPVSKALSWYYNDVIMSAMVSQITSASIVYSTVCSGADQRKHQNSASLAFVRGIHQWPVNSSHKGSVTRKCFHLMTSSWLQIADLDLLTLGYPSPLVQRDKLKRNSNQSAMVFMGKCSKKSPAKSRIYCLGLNGFNDQPPRDIIKLLYLIQIWSN